VEAIRKQKDTAYGAKGNVMYFVRVLAATGKNNRKLRVAREMCYSKSREGFTEAVRAIHLAINNGADLAQLLTEDGCAATIDTHDFPDWPSEEEVSHDIAIQLMHSRAGKDFASLTYGTPGTRH
jgi:hypothetical protein